MRTFAPKKRGSRKLSSTKAGSAVGARAAHRRLAGSLGSPPGGPSLFTSSTSRSQGASRPGQDLSHVPVRHPSPAPHETQASASREARGLRPDPRPGEVLRGRTAGEFIGDIVRPVGTALGNIGGAIVGAITGVSISSTTNTGPTWSPHGVFEWHVGLSTTGRSGWIIQEVTNGFRAQTAAGTAIANPFSPHYYEAWAVDASGNVTPNVGATNDMWDNPDFDATLSSTQGHWYTTAALYFTTTDPATQGFRTRNPATDAVDLLSSTSAPAGLGIARLHRYAQGTWDSTGATPTHDGSAGPR